MTKPIEKDIDAEDFYTPLHERKDFKTWAKEVILPAINKPVGTRQLKARLGDKLGDERTFTLAMALDYLVLHEYVWTIEKHVTMYTTKKPKDTVRKIPIRDREWNQGVSRPRAPIVPHFQQFVPKELA